MNSVKKSGSFLLCFMRLVCALCLPASRINAEVAAKTGANLMPEKKEAAVLPTVAAKEAMPKEEHPIIRTMEHASGEVTGIDSEHLSVLYKRTEDAEYEMNIPLDAKVKLDHYKNLSEIKVGDKVTLDYEKVVQDPKLPNERRSMTVKKIAFIKRPSQNKALQSGEKE